MLAYDLALTQGYSLCHSRGCLWHCPHNWRPLGCGYCLLDTAPVHVGILSAFAGCVPLPSPRSGDSRDSGSPSCLKRSLEVYSGQQGWGGSRHSSHSHCGGPAPSSTEYPGNPSLFVLCGRQRPPPSSLPCACQAPHPPVVGLGLTSSLLFCPYLPTPTPKGGAQTLSQNSRTPLTLCQWAC